MSNTNLVISLLFYLSVLTICISCVMYYSSEIKRRLSTSEEKYRNLEELTRAKDSAHSEILRNKESECLRMADLIKSLTEKNTKNIIDANIHTEKS